MGRTQGRELTFLDVFILVDGRSNGSGKSLIGVRLRGQLLEHLEPLGVEGLLLATLQQEAMFKSWA